MEHQQALIHLKDAAGCIHDADGFNAIWNYLADAEVNFQKQLQACLNAE